MAAGSTPTIYDPKILFGDSDVTNADTTQYTAPNEAGVKVMGLHVTNKTTAAITFRVWRETTGGTIYYWAYDVSVPPNGLPLFIITEASAQWLDPQDEIHTNTGAATGLDASAWGMEVKD